MVRRLRLLGRGAAPADRRGGERREIVLAGDGPATALAAASDGAMWFSTFRRMGRLAVDGSVTSFRLTAESGNLTAGPDGAMWIGTAGEIVRLDAGGATRVFRLPIELSPDDLISGSDGALWFSAELCDCIVRMTATGQRRLFRLPQAPDTPGRLALAPDGAIWFTHSLGLGRIATTGEFTLFDVPARRAHYRFAQDIAAGPDGAMWFTLEDSPLEPFDAEPDGSAIGRLDFSGANAAKLLVARLASGQLRGRAGGTLKVRFKTTRRAGGALVVVRTKPGVLTWPDLARTPIRPGAHSARVRLPTRPGTYRVMLRLQVASQAASDSASVRVSRARERPPGSR
jgi:streptogramin lyase